MIWFYVLLIVVFYAGWLTRAIFIKCHSYMMLKRLTRFQEDLKALDNNG